MPAGRDTEGKQKIRRWIFCRGVSNQRPRGDNERIVIIDYFVLRMETAKYWDKKRLETFVDAVIAIIMTILVLELKVPIGHFETDADLIHELGRLAPFFISYFIAFFTLVAVWLDHHRLFMSIREVDRKFTIINCIFLFTLSSLPFTAALAGEHIYSSTAVAIFLTNIFIMNVVFTFVFIYPQNKKWHEQDYSKHPETIRIRNLAILGMVIEIASIPLAFVHPLLGFGVGSLVLGIHLLIK